MSNIDFTIDCVKDTLLTIFDKLKIEKEPVTSLMPIFTSEIYKDKHLLEKYDSENIRYVLIQLENFNFIETKSKIGRNSRVIDSEIVNIMPEAHDFVAKTQNKSFF